MQIRFPTVPSYPLLQRNFPAHPPAKAKGKAHFFLERPSRILSLCALLIGALPSCGKGDSRDEKTPSTVNIEDFPGKEVRLDLSLSPRPLSCIGPDDASLRLETIPDLSLDSSCNVQMVRGAYIAAAKKSRLSCADSITCISEHYGALSVDHPATSIVFSLDRYAMEDIRSLEVFHDVSMSPLFHKRLQDRKLNLVYPGSGSHLPPLIMAFELIDQKKIDKAQLIYTELNPDSLERMRIYLGYWKEQGLLKGLREEEIDRGYRREHVFRATYQGKTVRGKTIELVFSMLNMRPVPKTKENFNRSDTITIGAREGPYWYAFPKDVPKIDKELWVPEKYAQNADLLVIHDSDIAEDFFKALKDNLSLSQWPLILRENRRISPEDMPFILGRYERYPGFYGCRTFGTNSFKYPMFVGNGSDGYRAIAWEKVPLEQLISERKKRAEEATVLQLRHEMHVVGSGHGGAILHEIKSTP